MSHWWVLIRVAKCGCGRLTRGGESCVERGWLWPGWRNWISCGYRERIYGLARNIDPKRVKECLREGHYESDPLWVMRMKMKWGGHWVWDKDNGNSTEYWHWRPNKEDSICKGHGKGASSAASIAMNWLMVKCR